MADYKTSKSGVFVDTKTGKVVESEPEEGIQLCAPGGELTPDVERDIADAKDAAAGVSKVGTLGTKGTLETAADDAPVESAVSSGKPRK